MTRSPTIPMLRVSTAAGSDPDVIEVDDAHEVYGDRPDNGTLTFNLRDLPRTCPRNGDGLHCVYADAARPDRCIYCGMEFAL